MLFVLVCTEGDVSEPAYIRALSNTLIGQVPKDVSTNIEVLPISLGGNQGHVKLIEVANEIVRRNKEDANSIANLIEPEDNIEKWIIVDYDRMDKRNIDTGKLREDAKQAGYTLIVNKPKFEFFVLASLSSIVEATANQKNLVSSIDESIKRLNDEDLAKGFTESMLLPRYLKKTHAAAKLFDCMLSNHPELIHKASTLKIDLKADCYTEMPKIIKRLLKLYK